MTVPVVASFSNHDVDVLVDFLDGIQADFVSKPRRDGVVSIQELEMAFRRVRRRFLETRKARDVKPIVEELLQAIEGNGMTIKGWFEIMDQLSIEHVVTQSELARGMRMLEMNGTDAKKQAVLTADKIHELFVYMDADHDGTLHLKEVALACNLERYRKTSSKRLETVTLMMQALDDYMGMNLMKIRDLFVHLDKDQSDGLSRAEIRCGFHAISAEAKRRQEKSLRRKQQEREKIEAREEAERRAELAREKAATLAERRRRLSIKGEQAWIPAPLANREDPWKREDHGVLYKAARGRSPAQALIVYFRSYKPEDSPVFGVVMHYQELLDNVASTVTKTLKYDGAKYMGSARILHPPDRAVILANSSSVAAPAKPEFRYIENDADWRNVLGRQFASNSEARLHRISKWRRDQILALSTERDTAADVVQEALGEMLEFVSNPDNLWAVTKEMLEAVASQVRAPRSESDEAPALAASVLWKLSEYDDFVVPLLKAGAAGACVKALEDLGAPWAGPLQYWLQVSMQTRAVGVLCRVGCTVNVDADMRVKVASALIDVVARPWGSLEGRKDYRDGVEGKTLSFASFALSHLVASSTIIRGAIAHRSRLFDAVVSALRPRTTARGAGGGPGRGRGTESTRAFNPGAGPGWVGGGSRSGGSPPQAVACAALCLAHVTTGTSASLLTRGKIFAAVLTLSGLLNVCIDQMEMTGEEIDLERGTASGNLGGSTHGTFLPVAFVMECAGAALWGCLSQLPDASNEEDSLSVGIHESCNGNDSVGSLLDGSTGESGGSGVSLADSQASDSHSKAVPLSAATTPAASTADETNDGDAAESSAPSSRKVLAACSLTLLRLLSHASICGSQTHGEANDSGDNGGGRVDDTDTRNSRSRGAGVGNAAEVRTLIDGSVTDNNTITGWDKDEIKITKPTADEHTISDAMITIAGSCLSRVAREIDFAAGPRGAMEGVLSLLLPSASLIVREQAALTLAEIAGQGYEVALGSQVAKKAAARRDDNSAGRVGGVVISGTESGGREELRLILWRHFCAGVVGGRGSQIMLDCASPGPPSRPNSLLLRERAARSFSLVCLCAGTTPASPAVLAGLVPLLQCRAGEIVGGAATAAVWALSREPENRKTFAKIRVVASLMPLCEWSREHGHHSLHLYCLAALYLLSQEPENALQVSNQHGSIAKLVSWATPPMDKYGCSLASGMTREDNAKTSSCLGVLRRCLLRSEGLQAVATGLASYSLLELVLQLLRVGVWARSVLPLTLREAQGILFAVQDRAEYRGYCERICDNNTFSVEDTLSLQLERPGQNYTALAGDAVVGLASLSVTLESRRRLAVNGTVQSIGRLLARAMAGDAEGWKQGREGDYEAVRNLVKLAKNLSNVPEAHERLSRSPVLPLITQLWQEGPDETTSRLACQLLANLSRSDVLGVRNRLFRSHLAAESASLRRIGVVGVGGSNSNLRSVRPSVRPSQQCLTVYDTEYADEESLSSSVFRRSDGNHKYGQSSNKNIGNVCAGSMVEDPLHRAARLNAQHRLRLTPAALWGERARRAEEAEETAEAAMMTTASVGQAKVPPGDKIAHASTKRQRSNGGSISTGRKGGRENEKAIAIGKESPASAKSQHFSVDGDRMTGANGGDGGNGFVAPVRATFVLAAALKRPAVTASVPLRWQSRSVSLYSLRDHGSDGKRAPSSACGVITKTTSRLQRRSKKHMHQQPETVNTVPTDDRDYLLTQQAAGSTDTCLSRTPNDRRTSSQRAVEECETPTTPEGGSSRDYEHGRGAGGIISAVTDGRPSTAPTHSDGKTTMRPLGQDSGGKEPSSVVFEPGFSRLRTRRVMLDRIYRFTRHQEIGSGTLNGSDHTTSDENQRAGDTAYSPPQLLARPGATTTVVARSQAATNDDRRNAYPNKLEPWKPPLLFQFCKDSNKTGGEFTKETIILEPTSPTTHFVFKPPARALVDVHGGAVVHAAGDMPGGGEERAEDRMRLDRFEHVPGSLVCRGSLGHVKGMDGRCYHHYASADRMWYMPEHPGPYPAPQEPPSLEELGITPPKPEPPWSPVPGEVPLPPPIQLPGMEPPDAPPLPLHYMKYSAEACARCNYGGTCPGQRLCPLMGVIPVESTVFLVDDPRLRDEFDDCGEPVVPEDGRAWSVETSSIFAQRKRQCESQAVVNTENVTRRRFETSFGRASKLYRFPRLIAEGNRDIAIKKITVKQEIGLVRETLWAHYPMILSSYNYYVSLDGVCGEPDSASYQLGREKFEVFLSDILLPREKENKSVEREIRRVFSAVNVEEDSFSAEGFANLDRQLCEQEWMEGMVRIGAILYRKETNNGSVAKALSRFMMELTQRLPKAAMLDPDQYRKERLYTESLEKALTPKTEGFRALFQTYPENHVAIKASRRRRPVSRRELLRFSLTDWEELVRDAGIYDVVERDKVKLVFLQSRMLVTDELLHRTKNCCLTPVDFLEALVRLADAVRGSGDVWPPVEDSFEDFCVVFFEGLSEHWGGRLKVQMAGDDNDQRTVLNFKAFMNKTAISARRIASSSTVSCAVSVADARDGRTLGGRVPSHSSLSLVVSL